jgi:hypothetical protein
MALGAHIHRMWTFPKLAKWQVVQDILRIVNAEFPRSRGKNTARNRLKRAESGPTGIARK